ncbi:phage regulatory protein/antirepressor Ant [Burkholderia multivorans]|uniref:phage regulatory protein/antirepressor Ant n=1 Tax=Burkholderia multivorans TaxID=87883 RepID=UPI001C22DCA2|nr:phage regulatory protein/antirepressor Ant [Burkholderia multivorans]MBU9259080.1 phage regulatory protein/antirepressor Ant [Burkholderia multivorans]
MNNLITFDPTQPVTMSSREIADLTGKRHPDVVRDIKNLMSELGTDVSKFARIYLDAMNREQTEFALPKRETLILVSGYNARMRAAIIDRWQELEAQAPKPTFQIPQTLGEALRLAADLEEQRAALEIENAEKAKLIEEQQPAVEFARAVQASDESISMGQLAKLIARQGIDIGERRLRTMLKEDGYLMKSGEPYQRYTEYFEMVVREWVSDSGRVHTGFTIRITPKGERYFLKRYGQKPVQVERKPNPPKIGLFKPRAIKE